ncbi:alcohol dehydrogenase catalytic domain-containing protein [Pendulispora rubella]|uniref:Alcohol dehydrogenase catalytic domain-containing protein n=1 Tax=Pendulispora rubella TaxID=2741070 RepID=A0ABZ2LDR1_9BACT
MKALTFDLHLPRLAWARALGSIAAQGYLNGLGPVRLAEVPDARVLGDHWVVVETKACGICGSDVKQVFMDAAVDNPLTAVISFPHVMGHEHVGTVVDAGRAVTRVKRGDRVACSPWFSCAVRGLPECDACQRGHIALCESFTEGTFAPGMHAGTCRDISGGFAPLVPVHESACFKIPDGVPFSTAVLADPFAVALHAVLKSPPEPGETVLVYGCGGLGVLVIHILARLFPRARVFAVDPRPHARALAEQLGAASTFSARGAELIEAMAQATDARVRRPQFALPWLHKGVDRVYDTVGSAATLETAVRMMKPLGSLVLVGVATPARFEWTPLYFKELQVMGSSGYGLEDFAGRRAHAFEHFFGLLERGELALDMVVTHRFPLADYKDAFLTARSKGASPSIKVVFDFG